MTEWLSAAAFSELFGITERHGRRVLHGFLEETCWRGFCGQARIRTGRGGRSGIRYEVLASSLPEALQQPLRNLSKPDESDAHAIVAQASLPPKFQAAPNQSEERARRMAVLRLIAPTERGSSERAQAIRDASHHHDVPVRTIQRWVKRCDDHGWDLAAFARKEPSDAGSRRVWVSRAFDKRFRAAGHDQDELEKLADWLTREIAGWWQSPVQRAGWKRVRLEVLTSLRRECRNRSYDLPEKAFTVSRRRIEELRYHSVVDVMKHDAKRFDDTKPRIRRDNTKFQPMEQIVMDVKPLDCVLQRPDGSLAYPKLIGFQDTGTHRLFCRIVLLNSGEGVRQEHVTSAFLDMVDDPNWGFPQQLYYDNGSEYAHFELIEEALRMVADEGARVLIKAKPYSGASKPIESKFAVLDRHITSLMDGYTGPNRMDKKIQRLGKKAAPFWGPVEEFEREFHLRLADFQSWPIGSGPFAGRSPMQVYHDHVANGWRPVRVNRLALDCAFAKQVGMRKIDRGVITIGPDRYHHPELAAFTGRRVRIVKPYRRGSWPLAELPELGWVALEPELLTLPGDISGAIEASRQQTTRRKAVRRLESKAAPVDPLANAEDRVVRLPTSAAPAPLVDVLMSPEAERFAGARIEADRKRADLQSAEQRLIARQKAETERLEKYLAKRRG
jgi:hypothetical protein